MASSIEEIKQRIAVANGESARLNSQRQVSIGRRDTLNDQLNSMLAKYKETYGVELTKDNIDSEVQRVTKEKEQEVAKIEQVLSLIKEGRYAEAEGIVNPTIVPNSTEAQVIAESMNSASDAMHTSSEVMNSAIDDIGSTPQPSGVVTQQPFVSPVTPQQPETVESPTPPVAPAPPVAPSEPVAPPQPVVPSEPVAPPQPVAPPTNDTGIPALNGFASPVGAPTTPVAPPAPPTAPSTPPTSFSAILGGTAFNPNN